jgi:hypothetical protein
MWNWVFWSENLKREASRKEMGERSLLLGMLVAFMHYVVIRERSRGVRNGQDSFIRIGGMGRDCC